MKKKLLSVLMLTMAILCFDALSSKSFLDFQHESREIQALESSDVSIQPYIFYDTYFEGENPKELLSYNKNIYLATKDILYKYDFLSREWNLLKEGKPVETTMGTIKGLTYMTMKDGLVVKDYFKIVSDINNDGKYVYELNLDASGEYQWERLIEEGKFCKELEAGTDSYSIYSYYQKTINSLEVKLNDTEYYLRNNIFYAREKDGTPQVIKEYSQDEVKDLNIVKFGEKIFVYGKNCGVEKVEVLGEECIVKYSITPIGTNKDIMGLTSADGGHSLFALCGDGNVYSAVLPNTWIADNESEFISEIKYSSNKEDLVKEIDINNNLYKIVDSSEWGKSYITVNGKILGETIRDTNGYPDTISRFSEGDNYIYVWSNKAQPIRIDIRDSSVVNMGENSLFSYAACDYEKIAKGKDGNIYIVNGDEIYRYLESERFYDVNLRATSIAILNDQCYGINETGLYVYNGQGIWELITDGNVIGVRPEELLVINNIIHCLYEGSLYKLNLDNEWEQIDSKVNIGLTSVYYVNDKSKKVYFVGNGEKETFVTIYDYIQNKWSKTKDLPDIKHIKSIAVEENSIYVGTQYVAEGIAYVYKNCTWSEILPQLNLQGYGAAVNSDLLTFNDAIYFYIDSSKEKANFGVWKMKDGSVTEVDVMEEKDSIYEILRNQGSFSTCNDRISFIIKNGQVFRKVS